MSRSNKVQPTADAVDSANSKATTRIIEEIIGKSVTIELTLKISGSVRARMGNLIVGYTFVHDQLLQVDHPQEERDEGHTEIDMSCHLSSSACTDCSRANPREHRDSEALETERERERERGRGREKNSIRASFRLSPSPE